MVFLALTLALLCVWATRALTAPLKRLAGAAEAFGARDDHVALPEAARARSSPCPGRWTGCGRASAA